MIRGVAAHRPALLVAWLLVACSSSGVDYLDYSPTKGLILPAPPPDQAQVVFLPAVHEGADLAIYEDGAFLLPLRSYTCHVRRTTPGAHRYGVVTDYNADFAEGELAGGATYLLLAYQTFAGRYSLRAVMPDERYTTLAIDDWIRLCVRVDPNAETALWRDEREPGLETRRLRDLQHWLGRPASERTRITDAFALHGDVAFVAR